MEPDNLALDQYVIDQCGKPNPRICFVPTASSESMDYIIRFYSAFAKFDCRPCTLSLFQQPSEGVEPFLLDMDIIYVGGGNTMSMLMLWRGWGVDRILRTAYENGTVLAGISAGALCWFEQGTTDSIPNQTTVMDALGFLPGSFVPHYDGEEERRPTYHTFIKNGEIKAGIACDDGAAVHFVDGELVRAVSSRPNAKAYTVAYNDSELVETPLEMNYLGK